MLKTRLQAAGWTLFKGNDLSFCFLNLGLAFMYLDE